MHGMQCMHAHFFRSDFVSVEKRIENSVSQVGGFGFESHRPLHLLSDSADPRPYLTDNSTQSGAKALTIFNRGNEGLDHLRKPTGGWPARSGQRGRSLLRNGAQRTPQVLLLSTIKFTCNSTRRLKFTPGRTTLPRYKSV